MKSDGDVDGSNVERSNEEGRANDEIEDHLGTRHISGRGSSRDEEHLEDVVDERVQLEDGGPT